jgi:dTDP-4-dehydrorhamnose 3,5-epimerase
MKIKETELDGVLVIGPAVFNDARGYFLETYNQKRYQEIGIKSNFVQDNLSFSKKGTLRGLHYQHPRDQAKLVQVIQGEVFDVGRGSGHAKTLIFNNKHCIFKRFSALNVHF